MNLSEPSHTNTITCEILTHTLTDWRIRHNQNRIKNCLQKIKPNTLDLPYHQTIGLVSRAVTARHIRLGACLRTKGHSKPCRSKAPGTPHKHLKLTKQLFPWLLCNFSLDSNVSFFSKALIIVIKSCTRLWLKRLMFTHIYSLGASQFISWNSRAKADSAD